MPAVRPEVPGGHQVSPAPEGAGLFQVPAGTERGEMKEEIYSAPGLGALRPATVSDVRSVLQGYLAHGGIPPKAITVALPLLDPAQAPPGFRARYRAASEGYEELARELQGQGVELKGSPGCLSWEIRVSSRDGQGSPATVPCGPGPRQKVGALQGRLF